VGVCLYLAFRAVCFSGIYLWFANISWWAYHGQINRHVRAIKMITEQDIINEEKHFQDVTFRINYLYDKAIEVSEDFTKRTVKNKQFYSEYQKALEEFHNTKSIWEIFEVNKAYGKIKTGDKDWISQAILYLEVDPFYFRSGYLKEKLLKALKTAPLVEEKERIQRMLIGIIKKCFRREMKYYCKLAKAVADEAFKDKIQFIKENEESSPEVKTRAEYVLKYISEK
jgi:hypothetical protein